MLPLLSAGRVQQLMDRMAQVTQVRVCGSEQSQTASSGQADPTLTLTPACVAVSP
jgi:uncharacterized ParB-like nuclease family protein